MFEEIGEAFRTPERTLGPGDPPWAGAAISPRPRFHMREPFPPTDDPGRARRRLGHQMLQDRFSAPEARRRCRRSLRLLGAGFDLATACDSASPPRPFFQVAEVDVAITADLGTLQRLTPLIPEGVVRELAYTGRRMESEEAARLGLVNRALADRDALVAAGLELARAIAAKSPLAVTGAKMSLNYSRGRTVEEGLRHVALWNAGALVSADLTAAVQGRLSKQVPEFRDLDG